MNTTTTPEETRDPIAETNVISFMKSEAARLAAKTAEPYAIVSLQVNHNGEILWATYCDGGTHCNGKTLAEAFAAQLLIMGPKARAQRMREEAAAILARADKLEEEGLSHV